MSQVIESIRLYKNHGNSIGYWKAMAHTDGKVIVEHAKKLDGKPVQSSYIAEAKNVGRSNETTPALQAISEVQSKARKQKDKGYVDTLEDAEKPVTNAMGLEKPMLATPLDKVKEEKICFKEAFVQPKLDGHRCLYKDGQLYSRQGKPLEIPHILNAIESSGLRDLHLDGELYVHGKPLQDISRLIKKYRPGESEILEYHLYDQVCDAPFLERITMMNESIAMVDKPLPAKLRPVLTLSVNSMDSVMAHHERFRRNGYEGTMLRFGNDPYLTGKRSRALLKVKEFHDAEFTVVDCLPGKEVTLNGNTYTPAVWVCITPKGKEFNVLAAGTAQEKHFQFVQRRDYIGRSLTVKYHYLSKDGVPQLPIALRFREDV